jgi:adenylate cyclase
VKGGDGDLSVADIASCFEGSIPAEIATASADGIPNVTHLSRVHMVDDDHVALSNQFFSKTMQNLAENPRACVCLIDPHTYESYKLTLQYERTERRGPLFERLRRDIDAIAALTGMSGVFKLRSADVYRVLSVDLVPAAVHENPPET